MAALKLSILNEGISEHAGERLRAPYRRRFFLSSHATLLKRV